MILNSLVIDKIRSYDHEEIEFPHGISLFEGDIGSGKSTVLMAIEFALFGLGSQKAESLLAKKAADGYVILEFSVDNEKYEIRRALKRKSSGVNQDPKNSWIRAEEQKEPLSPSELKQRVLQILKFNEPDDPKAESRIFRYAIFTPQETMKEVLSDARKRLETIRRAFGIEDYNVTATNAKEVSSEIKTQMILFQERCSNILELQLQIQNSEKIIQQIDLDSRKLEADAGELKVEKIRADSELKQLQAKNQERTKLETNKENLKEKSSENNLKIAEINKEISESKVALEEYSEKLIKMSKIKRPTSKSVREIEIEIKKFQEINNELIKTQSQVQNISERVNKIKNKLGDKIKSHPKELDSQIIELKKELESFDAKEIKEKLDLLNKQKIENETIKNTLEKEVEKFTKLGAKCPTCEQKITKEHHHKLETVRKKTIVEINLKLKEMADSFFELKSESKKMDSRTEESKKKIAEIGQLIPDIKEYQESISKIAEFETKIKELQKKTPKIELEYQADSPVEYLTRLKDEVVRFENLEIQIEQITQNKTKTSKLIQKYQEERQSLETTIEKQQEELVKMESKISLFDDLDDQIRHKENQIDAIHQEINKISSLFAAAIENKRNEQERISESNLKIAESKKWELQYKKFSQSYDWLTEFFIPTVNQIEKQVLLSILQNFNETYRRWYSILVEDPTKESSIDENFTPIVNQDGYEQEISFLSGGEKTSIALAYRLTLNSLMRKETESMKSNLLILDEPTDGFSKNQLGKIREVLDELKSEQIILVSHEKELEAYVDNIFQISKQDGISKVSRMN